VGLITIYRHKIHFEKEWEIRFFDFENQFIQIVIFLPFIRVSLKFGFPPGIVTVGGFILNS
jgi:hypothetical protein